MTLRKSSRAAASRKRWSSETLNLEDFEACGGSRKCQRPHVFLIFESTLKAPATYPSQTEHPSFGHLWGPMAAMSGKESLPATLLADYVEVSTALVMIERAFVHPRDRYLVAFDWLLHR